MSSVAELFAYDASSPLRLEVIAVERRTGVDVSEIRFDNGTGGTASAFLTEPAGSDLPRAGVVVAHGGTKPGKHKLLDEAIELSRRGMVGLCADTSMPPLGDADTDRAATVAGVLVQRRALDVLESRSVTGLGYYGHSLGGERGGILCGVESRLGAIVIAASGTGLVAWLRDQGFTDEAYLEASDRLDPVHFVGLRPKAHLLFQHGRQDRVFPLASGRALYEAAAEPKAWREYECTHSIDVHPPARADRLAFFEELLAA
jgi:hypothetical protein